MPPRSLDVYAPCLPPKATHHAKRIVHIRGVARLADTPALRRARKEWTDILAPFRPITPLTGALRLALQVTWPWVSSDRVRQRVLGHVPHDRKPDCDNLAKTVTDCLVTLGYLVHDSRIVHLDVKKWRGSCPGVRVRLESVEGDL